MPSASSPRPSVLIVDDDEVTREALAEALEPLSCELVLAERTAEAEAHLRARRFDVLVLDVALSDGTGFSIAERLRAEGHLLDSELVFVTGLSLTDDLMGRALALGCSDLVQKPIAAPIFRARLRALLQLAVARQRLQAREADLRQTSQMLVGTLRQLSQARRQQPAQAPETSASTRDEAVQAANEALETLRLSEERYRLAARASNDVLWDWELGSDTMHWGASLATELNHSVDVRDGFCVTTPKWRLEQIHPDDCAAVQESLDIALRSGAELWTHEYRFRRGTGAWATVLDRCCVVRNAAGEPVRLVGAMQNITSLREQEALAKERADFQQQLIGIVSHDLRNPIGAISLGAAVMLNRGNLPANQELSAKQIQQAADRASRMVRDLLDFTRARLGGGIPVQPRSVDLKMLVEQVVREIAAAGAEKPIALAAEGDLQGTWDPDRVQQVVQNLIGNAVAYSPAGSEVRVRLEDAGPEVRLSVHNRGEPIPPEQVPHLFDPLRRGKGKDGANPSRSVGLGLYIVQNIARAHGGMVDVQSSAEEGTTFTVILPRQSAAYTSRGSGVFSLRALKAAQEASRKTG